MDNLFNVSTAPHIRSSITTKNIMYDVIISLLPATFFGIYQFGFNAFLVITTAIITAVLSEYLYQRLMKLPITIKDCLLISSPSFEQFPDVLERDDHHQEHQQREAREVDVIFEFLRNLLPDGQHTHGVHDEEENLPAVERGQRQQVHHREVHR